MPLTHVCIWDSTIGYRRITVEEASALYPYGVSASSGHFVCELCGQNVGFSKARIDTGTRYFFHNSAEQDKDCEERQTYYDTLYNRSIWSINSHTMPLRIALMHGFFELQLGFFFPPVNYARCDFIRISCDAGKFNYSFDRIEKDKTTYLSVGSIPSTKYEIEYDNPSTQLLMFWSKKVIGIRPSGSLFDARSGKIIQPGGKASSDHFYYLLLGSTLPLSEVPIDIEATELTQCREHSYSVWHLYRIEVKRFSELSAKFFLRYAIFLTEKATDFYPIWPAYVKDPYCLYHNAAEIYYYLCGDDAELKSFPSTKDVYNTHIGRLYRLSTQLREQLVSLGKSGALGFAYLVRQSLNKTKPLPCVEIKDTDGTLLIDETYIKLPRLKLISVTAPYDGKAVIMSNGKIKYIYKINGTQTFMIDGLSLGMEIYIYQGCDLVRKIVFEKKSADADNSLSDIVLVKKLKACTGPNITISHGVGAIAGKLSEYPLTREWLLKAIRRGEIPRSAYMVLCNNILQTK
ncbi:hypothetical protein [uncultured Ruminococcus sp.]|uniref:hypothetical protein n=1 Tax=uncultured Ruminococcus sp. TaxID=165186 RepID=UPI00292E4A7F|nr:hypothetical protein [uncultured Ruminococcus sp.]